MDRAVVTLFLLVVAAHGAPSLTVGEVTYENVTLKKEYPQSFFIQHDGGTAFIERRKLSEEQIAQLAGSSNNDSTVKPQTVSGSAAEDYNEAKRLLRGEDEGDNWTRGVELMQRAAEAGHPAAQYEWGVILIDAFCVEQDGNKGEEFLRKAAEAGDGQAIRQLALWERDPEKSAQGIKNAAEAGDGHAMVYLTMTGGWPGVGDAEADSRAWLDKAFATGNPEVIVHAASMLNASSSNPKSAERLRMTKEEMQAKAIEALRAGRKDNVLDAYYDLALMLRRGDGVEKNEAESEELMSEFNRRAGQRAAKGSIAARLNLMKGLQISGAADANSQVLRLATEILERSNYPGHYTAAALFGARSVEGNDPKSAEGISRALAWLKERQAEKNDEGIAGLIKSFEERLAKASPETAVAQTEGESQASPTPETESKTAPETLTADEASMIGQEAADMRLIDAEQKETSLSALRGKVVLLNFNFAEGGCDETCNPDFPILAELQEKHKDDPVEVVSVLTSFDDQSYEDVLRERAITWKTSLPYKLPGRGETPEKLRHLEPLSARGQVGDPFKAYGVKSLATNIVVDKNGMIVGRFQTLNGSRQDVEAAIAKALAD